MHMSEIADRVKYLEFEHTANRSKFPLLQERLMERQDEQNDRLAKRLEAMEDLMRR